MYFKNVHRLILISLLSLACVSCGSSSKSDPLGAGSDPFKSALVRVTDLEAASRAAFANIGTDTLANGRVRVQEEEPGRVKVEVNGAAPNMSYSVQFCSFATGTSSCLSVGSLTTNGNGNAEAELQFPQHGVFAGVFLLTRNNQNQFVNGFTTTVHSSSGGENEGENENEEEQEFEADLQRVSAVTGGLGSAFGTAGSDPLTSGRVELEDEREENEGNEAGSSDEREMEGAVEVRLKGAAANAAYTAEFCRFGVGPSGCVSLGSVQTDAQGNAKAELAFPLTGTFDGIFLLTRTVNGQVLNEFVTAVSM